MLDKAPADSGSRERALSWLFEELQVNIKQPSWNMEHTIRIALTPDLLTFGWPGSQ